MIHIGIDPGISGAIAFITEDDDQHPNVRKVIIHDMPTIQLVKTSKTKKGNYKKENLIDIPKLRSLLTFNQDHKHAIIEKQQAYPKQGSVSNYTTGFGYGIIKGLLVGLGIPFTELHPKTWQKIYKQRAGSWTKDLSYSIATNFLPDMSEIFRGPRGGLMDGRSDAFLIANTTFMQKGSTVMRNQEGDTKDD